MIGLGRLERYVLRQMLIGLGVALAIISALVLLVQFVELSGQVGTRADVGANAIFQLTLLRAPSLIQVLLPFCFLFGGMGAYVTLNRKSELVAMRAAGVSAWRFILPSAAVAALLGAITVAAVNPLAAALGARYESERARLMEDYLGDLPQDVWLRQGDSDNQIVIHARDREVRGGTVRLYGVSVFMYRKGAAGAQVFHRRLEAAEAQLMPGFWRLTDVREATAGANAIRHPTDTIPSNLDDEGAMERFASPEAIAFWRLPQAIRLTEQAGFSADGYRLRFQELLSTPLIFAAMVILGAAFSLRLTRLGGLAGLAGAGVGVGFVIFFFNQFAGALGKADIIPLLLAAWAPGLVALLAGTSLLCYTEDG